MKELLIGLLPCVLASVVTLILVIMNAKKNKSYIVVDDEGREIRKVPKGDYLLHGMCIGMSFGVAVGTFLLQNYGLAMLSYGICIGMLIGAIIGMMIKKK